MRPVFRGQLVEVVKELCIGKLAGVGVHISSVWISGRWVREIVRDASRQIEHPARHIGLYAFRCM